MSIERSSSRRDTNGRPWALRKAVLSWILLVAGASSLSAGSSPSSWEATTAAKLIGFLPAPVEGLSRQFPWDPKLFNQARPVEGLAGWSREEIPYDPDFAPIGVIQHWRIADPGLLDQVKRAEQDAGAQEASLRQGNPGAARDEEALSRQMDVLQEKMDKAVAAGDMAEIQRISAQMQQAAAPATSRTKKVADTENRPKELKASARELRVVIQANLMPRGALIAGVTSAGKGGKEKTPPAPVATIQGYPVGRNEHDLNGGTSFSVSLAPPGFKTKSDAGPYLRKEVKALYVMVEVFTDTQHQAADEALALKMLGRVDLTGLTKLLAP